MPPEVKTLIRRALWPRQLSMKFEQMSLPAVFVKPAHCVQPEGGLGSVYGVTVAQYVAAGTVPETYHVVLYVALGQAPQ